MCTAYTERYTEVMNEACLLYNDQTPSKLKCGIPIWENSEEYWYLLLKKFVFPKVLAKWKKKKKCSVEFSKDDTTSLTKTYNSCKKDSQSRIPF